MYQVKGHQRTNFPPQRAEGNLTASIYWLGFPGGTNEKEPTCHCRRRETWVRSLGSDDSLEEGMATHS